MEESTQSTGGGILRRNSWSFLLKEFQNESLERILNKSPEGIIRVIPRLNSWRNSQKDFLQQSSYKISLVAGISEKQFLKKAPVCIPEVIDKCNSLNSIFFNSPEEYFGKSPAGIPGESLDGIPGIKCRRISWISKTYSWRSPQKMFWMNQHQEFLE